MATTPPIEVEVTIPKHLILPVFEQVMREVTVVAAWPHDDVNAQRAYCVRAAVEALNGQRPLLDTNEDPIGKVLQGAEKLMNYINRKDTP